MNHRLIQCTHAQHAQRILDIFNDAILTSTALYDYQPRTLDSMTAWFEHKHAHHYPIIGVEDDTGQLLGFASYGSFRPYPAYKYTVEHSIYVHKDARGHGLGHILLKAIINAAQQQDYHALIGAIDANNQGSIALHLKHGFTHVGTLPQVGFKFNDWLDLAFYQRLLSTPNQPVDG